MLQSRDEVRQVYLDVWQKMQQKVLLEPMEAHPEYHSLLEIDSEIKQQDFTPDQGQTNPFLHMGMHIALREQAGTDRPPGIKAVYQKLVSSKGQHEAEHAMMECLGQALWNAQRSNQMPDEAIYLDCLQKL
jgi:hypothetical protein